MLDALGRIMGVHPEPIFVDPRPGVIRNSRADVSRARAELRFQAEVPFEEGLRRAVDWFVGREGS